MRIGYEMRVLAVATGLFVGPGGGWCWAKEPPAAKRAGEILEAAGVKGGLIVHMDCGRGAGGRLTAALGRAGGFVVRGLARDAVGVAEARRHVAAAGRSTPGTWALSRTAIRTTVGSTTLATPTGCFRRRSRPPARGEGAGHR